jgi:ATP-binding cassette subfamily B protein
MSSLLNKFRRSTAKPTSGRMLDPEAEEEQRYGKIDLALMRRMAKSLRPFRRFYVIGTTLAACQLVLEMAGPKFIEWIINDTSAIGKRWVTAMPPSAAEIHAADWHLGRIILLWAFTLAGAIVLQRFTILAMTGAGERVQFAIRRQLFAHLQKLSMSYFDKTKLGRIISRCTGDIEAMREVNVWGLSSPPS